MIPTWAVDLSRKAMSVSTCLTSSTASNDHGESGEDVALGSFTQPAGGSQVTPVAIRLKRPVRAMAESMYDTLRLSLTVKMNQLFSSGRVFQQDVASRASTKRIGSIRPYARICGFNLVIRVDMGRLELVLLFVCSAKSFWKHTNK